MGQNDKTHLWTVEEEVELVELVHEQKLTFINFPELAWERIAVQTGKTPEQCRRHWEWMGIRKHDPSTTPFYMDDDHEILIL